MKYFRLRLVVVLLFVAIPSFAQNLPYLKISKDQRGLSQGDKPFFWLGDTGWLLFSRLNRDEAERYLDDRRQKGFNVVQVMYIHTLKLQNVYGDSALIAGNLAQPLVTQGNDFRNIEEYDYWDHVDWVIEKAASKGIYLAVVPIWGANVKDNKINAAQAKVYGEFLAKRMLKHSNIIWLNGGDILGTNLTDVWQMLAKSIRQFDSKHLMTFHPRGRYSSSDWFHDEPWLDFNMVQSGHRDYLQDTIKTEKWRFGEDNWRYLRNDFALKPIKPTIESEPSYETAPHGLHNPQDPRWNAADVRRYGYWAVLNGSFGYTYGHNSVMQMHQKQYGNGDFGANDLYWNEGIKAEGSTQMVHIRNLIEKNDFYQRQPDESFVIDQGVKYNHIAACRGQNFVLVYTFTGRNFKLDMAKINLGTPKATWYNPRNGEKMPFVISPQKHDIQPFDPPLSPTNGNDWVLILERK